MNAKQWLKTNQGIDWNNPHNFEVAWEAACRSERKLWQKLDPRNIIKEYEKELAKKLKSGEFLHQLNELKKSRANPEDQA